MNGTWHVIKAELFKARFKKRSYMIAAFFWLIVPIFLLIIGWFIEANLAGTEFDEAEIISSGIQFVASPIAIVRNNLLIAGLGSPTFLMIVLTLIAAVFIGEERTQNMWKTTITSQPSRVAILLGKLAAAMILLAIMFLGAFLSGLILGGFGTLFLPTSFAGDWLQVLGYYGLQWAFCLCGMSFAFLMIWLLRSWLVGAIAIFILPVLLEGIYSIYSFAVGFDRVNRFNALIEFMQLRRTFENLPQYFFTTNFYIPSWGQALAIANTEILADDFLVGNPFFDPLNIDLTRSSIVMLVYTVIFCAILFWSFLRRDVS